MLEKEDREDVIMANSLIQLQENGIPFSMNLNDLAENRAIRAMKAASRIAEENGIADMTLDEINAEIAEARK